MMQKEAVSLVSSDVNFPNGRFPDYKLSANNVIVDLADNLDQDGIPLREIIAKETSQLLQQHEKLSARDLKEKFEKAFSISKLTEEINSRGTDSVERQVLLRKLRDVLDSLKGRVVGRNKEDTEEAISLVEVLADQLTRREGELMFERKEVKKLVDYIKQVTEEAQKVIEGERALARAEITKSRDDIVRAEQEWFRHEAAGNTDEDEEFEELLMEVREARRILMLHQPNKVLDMECELQALRSIMEEKSQLCNQLTLELATIKGNEATISGSFYLDGLEHLGSQFKIVSRDSSSPDASKCLVQWYRASPAERTRWRITGATGSIYSPEPSDTGMLLQAEITINNECIMVQTMGAIISGPSLGNYVEELLGRSDVEFNVKVEQMNNKDVSSDTIHVFHVGKQRLKLRRGRFTKAREQYSAEMQLCGSRGSGIGSTKAVFWKLRKGVSFSLAFESTRDRNAAIMVARKYASKHNVILKGPEDPAQ